MGSKYKYSQFNFLVELNEDQKVIYNTLINSPSEKFLKPTTQYTHHEIQAVNPTFNSTHSISDK